MSLPGTFVRLPRVFVAALLVAGATIGSCRADTKPPYEIVRSLQALHDQMAQGSQAAQRAMPGLLRRLGGRLMIENASVWHDPRNVWAVVVYVLSGGETRVARFVLANGKCNPQERQLLEGSLAYLEGNKATAKALLANIDPRSLEPAVGSHLALAQATLAAQENPEKSMRLLDMARVIAPGTLVEEAALRREIFLASETNDFNKFIAMSDQYLRRFQRSVYAEGFHRGFANSVVRLSQSGNVQQLVQLGELLTELSSKEQLAIYLTIAQSSLQAGKLESAKWAGDVAVQMAPTGSVDARRATLYEGAAEVLMAHDDRGLAAIENLDTAHLPHDDLLLKQAVIGIAAQIRQWPSPPVKTDQQALSGEPLPRLPPAVASAALPGKLAPTMSTGDAMIAFVQKELDDSDQILEGGAP
jgi:chemotaxis protein MotC